MRPIMMIFVLFACCYGAEKETWLDQVQTRVDQEAIDWLREKIQQDFHQMSQTHLSTFTQDSCKNCFFGGLGEMEPKIYVFMSFSIPEKAWLQLSEELEKYSGVFVVTGLPNHSFQDFAKRVIDLKMKGLSADIQINPALFKRFQVREVPTFVVLDQQDNNRFSKVAIYSGTDDWDKISGNISLTYALEVIAKDSARSKEDFYSKLVNRKEETIIYSH